VRTYEFSEIGALVFSEDISYQVFDLIHNKVWIFRNNEVNSDDSLFLKIEFDERSEWLRKFPKILL
jgi:hypothetical protein